jgi:hypothetical protein
MRATCQDQLILLDIIDLTVHAAGTQYVAHKDSSLLRCDALWIGQ